MSETRMESVMQIRLDMTRGLALLCFIAPLLGGCAAQMMHSDGLDLIQEGKVEEGLTKLNEASQAEPDNVTYRSDYLRNRNEVTKRLLANAAGERAQGHLDVAQAIYQRVLAVDPGNRVARAALDGLEMDRRHAAQVEEAQALFKKGELDDARAALKPVFLENPMHGAASVLLRQIDEQQAKAQVAEPVLKGKFKRPVTLQFRDMNVKMVFEALSRLSGLNVLLDKDVRPDIRISIFVKDVSAEDAVDLILMQGQLEKKVLNENTVYIYPSTPSKSKEFQDLKIRSFHLTNADPKQMMAMLKTLLKSKDIFVHEKTNSLVMRDTPAAIQLAEKMIADQDVPDPEVMLEVEILEISRARLSEIGLKFPGQFAFSALPNTITADATTTAAAVTQLSLFDLKTVDSSTIIVNPTPTVTLNAMLQDSDTNILSSPRLRVRNRDKAKIMIGERVPIITNSVTPVATGTPVVTGSVSYQDVGLKLDVEPEIHLDNEVTIKVGLEVSSLGLAVTNSAGSQVYRIGTRNTSTTLRLRNGETQILAGLITDEDRSTADKVPALGEIPLLGRLFSSKKDNKSKTEIILSITPHIVAGNRVPDARATEYWSGTEAALRSRQLSLSPQGTVSQSAPSSGAGGLPYPPVPVAVPVPAVPPRAAEAQTISMSWQGPAQASVGDKVTLSLLMPTTQGAKSLGFRIGFDPAALKVVEVVEGEALKRDGAQSTFTRNVDQAKGEIAIEATGAGMTSSATLATVTFEVTGAAQASGLSVHSITATGANGEVLTVPVPAPHVIALTQGATEQ